MRGDVNMYEAQAIDALTAKVNELARMCAHLGRENAELRSQVSALSAWGAPAAGTMAEDDRSGIPSDGRPAERAAASRMTRRAAVGVALAGAAAGIAGVTALVERNGSNGPTAEALAQQPPAELAAAEQAAAAGPTTTGSVLNGSLSTASAVVAGTNTSTGSGVTGANSSTGPGVHGMSTHGRGGIFAGGAAQIQLSPAGSTHPKSGQRGDLYADAAGRLWYCKTTGATAAWHQIA